MNLPEFIESMNNAHERFKDRVGEAAKLLQAELEEARDLFYGSFNVTNVKASPSDPREDDNRFIPRGPR